MWNKMFCQQHTRIDWTELEHTPTTLNVEKSWARKRPVRFIATERILIGYWLSLAASEHREEAGLKTPTCSSPPLLVYSLAIYFIPLATSYSIRHKSSRVSRKNPVSVSLIHPPMIIWAVSHPSALRSPVLRYKRGVFGLRVRIKSGLKVPHDGYTWCD